MAEKESYEAARDALRKIRDHPDRHAAEHEEHLLRYLQGVAYRDERAEAREPRKQPSVPAGPAASQTWVVQITVDRIDPQRSHAEARLVREGSALTGEGTASRSELDQTASRISAELAAARALAALSHRMLEKAAAEIEQTGPSR